MPLGKPMPAQLVYALILAVVLATNWHLSSQRRKLLARAVSNLPDSAKSLVGAAPNWAPPPAAHCTGELQTYRQLFTTTKLPTTFLWVLYILFLVTAYIWGPQ